MNWLRIIFVALLLGCGGQMLVAEDSGHDADQDVDVAELVFGHIGDTYGWHITTWKGNHVTLPLPCIVRSSTGWHVFMSSRLEHGGVYEGLFIDENCKIMELRGDGQIVRPFDISITKNVASLMFSAVLLVVLVLYAARWYRSHDASEEGAPGGFAGLMELLVVMVDDELIRPSISKDNHARYAPYLLTVFFFIFLSNLLGIVPFFPGGANVTGNIAVTMVLALFTFFMVNLFADRHYWKEILWPEAPIFLKFPLPVMQIIEIFGMLSKPFSLMVRLFANILAGHAMILGLVAVIFVTAKLGPLINGTMTVITLIFGVFMDCLELLVAFIQAYVFTMLSAVFIGMSGQGHSNP